MSDYSLIQELKREGSLRVFHAYDSGSLIDHSGNGFDGAPTDVEFGARGGLCFYNNTSLVTVTYGALLQVTDWTIISTYNNLSRYMTDVQRLAERGNVSGSQNFDLYFSVSLGRLTLATSGTVLINHDFSGAQFVAVTLESGAVPNCYVDGVLAGAFSDTATSQTTASNLIIGNRTAANRQLLNQMRHFLLVAKELDATEISQIYGELMS